MAETIGVEGVRALKIDQKDKTKGFRNRQGYVNSFAAQSKSSFDISWPHDVDLLQGEYFVPAGADPKNQLWVEIAPNTDLALLVPGAGLAAGVASGDTEVVLNAQAKAALDAFLTDEQMQTQRVYFRLTSVPGDPLDWTNLRMARWDSDNAKLVSPDGSAFGLTAGVGDKVFVTIRWEDGTYIPPGFPVRIGDETSGSSNLPAGTLIRMIVDNKELAAREIPFNLTYLHD